MALTIETPAPDFKLFTQTTDGLMPVQLSSFQNRSNVVLVFFPGVFTAPCTKELCELSDGIEAFKELDATVIGISVDSPFAQDGWAKAKGITITLVSDYARTTVRDYDVEFADFAGLGATCAKRAVYVIDRSGVIRHVQVTPSLGDMPDFEAVKAAISALDGNA